MASRPERLGPRRSRALLAAWVAAAFGLAALRDPASLAAAALLAGLLFRRGLGRNLLRTARGVLPLALGAAGLSLVAGRAASGAWPAWQPAAALVLRAALIALVTFSVLDRADLLRALAPFPALSRLLTVTLAQIHALRLLATESREGLVSRLPRRPGPLDLLRNAGAIAAALFTLSVRNAREISQAMRSRGF
ncbi:MAG: hypothetical protein HZB56_04050 [Deltaproteobacteria bacterium]|nr:hypothetical protein [Deltaproteobacteria bacterium]